MKTIPRLLTLCLGFATCAAAAPAAGSRPAPLRGPIFNQDSTEFFFDHTVEEMSGPLVDSYIDELAACGVGTFVSNVNAQRANYASQVWETDWQGYEPKASDDQPVLRYLSPASRPATRRRLDSAMRLASMGVNFHARALARCRRDGIGAWVSVRMNDLHDCRLADSPLLSTFYKNERATGLLRSPYADLSWSDRALDWERPEVQDHYFILVREQLQTLDLDGLELDWMRFGYHFRPGHELEGGRVITAWMRRVRAECAAASVRLGHPVRLGVRVPSRPETARRCGLDAVAWAREGLVDLVVVTPFWATIEFDMPMLEWKRLLEGTGVRLAGGLEIRYQPVPNGPAGVVTPELAAGAAMSVLHGGGDLVYLFNYMPGRFTPDTDWGNGVARTWGVGRYRSVLRAMRSEEGLEPIARTHAITYPDIRAPGDPAAGALPGGWRGEDMPWPSGCSFRIPTGPRPSGRAVTLVIGFTPETRAPGSTKFYVNGVPCPGRWDPADRMLAVPLPAAILQDEAQVVQAYASPGNPFAIVKAEIAVAAR